MQINGISSTTPEPWAWGRPPGSFGCTGSNLLHTQHNVRNWVQVSNEGCHKGLVYCQYVVWEKQSTYRVSSLGPVQEDPGWRAWCRCCPRPPQSSGPGSRVVGLPATICEQTVIAQRPNTRIGQWAMCCKTTINSFLLYNYEQYGGLGRLNTSCTNTHSNRFFPIWQISVYCNFPYKF